MNRMSRKYIADKLQELLAAHLFDCAALTREETRVLAAAIVELRKTKKQ